MQRYAEHVGGKILIRTAESKGAMHLVDLHSHILPGIDDGARDVRVALAMARAMVAGGIRVAACTPHILPGLYHNTGPQIRRAVAALQGVLDEQGVGLRLVTGADNHIVPDFVAGLRSGHLLTLADSAYVLVEPPHHVAPARLETLFFNIRVAGYVPILTHPERLTWLPQHYGLVRRLIRDGVLMQITAGSLGGRFGREPRYWAERMLGEGLAHVLATDAHDAERRPPDLAWGYELAVPLVGEKEAAHLVATRPQSILENIAPTHLPIPAGETRSHAHESDPSSRRSPMPSRDERGGGGMAGRLWRLFE